MLQLPLRQPTDTARTDPSPAESAAASPVPPGFDFFDPALTRFPTIPAPPGPARAVWRAGWRGAGPGFWPGMRGGMGAGMGAGMGGAPGGMMGAGMMRGPFARGGAPGGMMGGGMMGAMMGGGAGGMMGGMMGPGMGGGMGAALMGGPGAAAAGGQPPEAPPAKPAHMHLFGPGPLLKLLYILFYPLKLVLWAILPLVVLATLSLFNNFGALLADMRTIVSDVSNIAQIAIGIFIVNLVSRLAQGVAIVAHGGKVPGLGINLVLGIMPRFYIDKSGIADLDRRGQLWAHGAPLLARLGIFALGTLAWAITRDQGGMLPLLALIAAQFGFITFLVTSWPLMLSDGAAWLAVLFNEPRLVFKAGMAFRHVFLRGRLPPSIQRRDALPLALYAVGVLLSMTLILGVLATGVLTWLERSLDGLGVLIYLGLVGAFTLWLVAVWGTVKARKPAGPNGAAFDKAAFREMLLGAAAARGNPAETAPGPNPALSPEAGPLARMMAAQAGAQRAPEPLVGGHAKVVWGVILLALVILAFQPYTYEAGGQVEILPAARAQAVARTEGEIISVTVSEGDIVTPGQVLGHLSSWDQERQVRVTRALLDAAEANLARLLAGPKPEEIEVARRRLESARASVVYSRAEAERTRELAASGVESQQAADRAQSVLDTDLANLAVSEASLALVMSGATENDIDMARAEVDRLSVELAFWQDELERTRIVSPMEGRVVTADLQLLTGTYLRVGEPLLEIENSAMVSAVIAVPESDITLVSPGDRVRLKAWGQSDIEVEGSVQTIAPAAQQETYGNVVRVIAAFPNPDDFIRSGMTGYAKIEGAEMRAWEAYLRSIRRFFQIEVWSWIP